LGLAIGLAFATNAMAVTTIPFWHSMEGELGKEVDSLAQRFNDTHPDYKIVPVYKGNYEQSLSAGIAAFRTGNAPALLQVYEVGTATMMASKAIKPVYEVFKDAGINFDESQFVPTVSGYYTDSKTGHLLSQPFNSSTPVLYYNKDAFKKAGLNPEQPPKTWQDLAEYTAKLKAAGMKCGYASGWQGWIQIGRKLNNKNIRPLMTLATLFFVLGLAGFMVSDNNLIYWGVAAAIFTVGEIIYAPGEYMLIDSIAPPGMKSSYFSAQALGWLGAAFNPMFTGIILTHLPHWSLFAIMMVAIVIAWLMILRGMRVSAWRDGAPEAA
jgi:ABC-type glycerol-3-phosphate transport system substrate-binding protein